MSSFTTANKNVEIENELPPLDCWEFADGMNQIYLNIFWYATDEMIHNHWVAEYEDCLNGTGQGTEGGVQ